MEVILLERINRLGAMGDIVKVKDGFARNFLIPMKKAMRATEDSKKLFEARRAEIEAENAKTRDAAQIVAKKLEGLKLSIIRQASQEGKLYGSVTVRDIEEALKEAGHVVPKSQIVLPTIIKTTGDYPVRLTLHAEVIVPINLSIVRVENDAA
ncbi:MAG: 50S ribosomal protein L9 [Alphaproteobacteria bacterium]|nr:50S ribosomal protein L9 [Alphaproteobacteria bacterium]